MKYKGYIEYFTFRSPDLTYGIYNLVGDDFEDGEMKCVGSVVGIDVGDFLEIEAEEEVHPTYGPQLRVSSFKVMPPEDLFGVERYLASGAIKGVGAALASRIVKKFKGDTFRIMEEEPERLAEIKGISLRMASEIGAQVIAKRDLREAMIFLSGYGISNSTAVKLYKKYDSRIYSIIEEDPYLLAEEVNGIGFRTADEIAMKSGIALNNPKRVQSGIIHLLHSFSESGHTYVPKDILIDNAASLMEIDKADVGEQLLPMSLERKILIKNSDCIYLQSLYFAELRIAEKLKELYDVFASVPFSVSEHARILAKTEEIKNRENIGLDEVQTEAVVTAAERGILLLTGGPGTGKTSTIRAMIKYFEGEGDNVLLCAPTGRAAKRMEEATGYASKTVHRLLEVAGSADDDESTVSFMRNRFNPLEADVVIVDEMSMVDTFLFASLLDAIPAGCRLILSGDCAQLPSVGPGNVLNDLLMTKDFARVVLEKIYRQSEGGDIAGNADRIRRGELPEKSGPGGDFYYVERSVADAIYRDTVLLLTKNIPAKFGIETKQIQVLTPMKAGNLGVNSLNKILQTKLNPPAASKREMARGEIVFREGDKVMQIKNNYSMKWRIVGINGITGEEGEGVFNGDTGIVSRINLYDQTLTVAFDDDREVEYERENLDELELAYAITIHKSQGSEYPAVIIPLLDVPRMLMTRNLLYTAVSRGTKCVMLMGDWAVVKRMTETDGEQKRYTGLQERLKEVFS